MVKKVDGQRIFHYTECIIGGVKWNSKIKKNEVKDEPDAMDDCGRGVDSCCCSGLCIGEEQ